MVVVSYAAITIAYGLDVITQDVMMEDEPIDYSPTVIETHFTPESCFPCIYSSFVCRDHCEAWVKSLRWGSNPEARRKEKKQ